MKLEAMQRGAHFRAITAVITVLFFCSVTVTAFAASTGIIKVTVVDGTNIVEFPTKNTAPKDIVAQAGFMLSANDELDCTHFDADEGGTITIKRAQTLRVVDEDDIVYCVGYSTVGNTLEACGLALNEADETDISLEDPVQTGMQVVIKRAFRVVVEADGEKKEIYTTGATVEEVLEEAGVETDEADSISHKITAPVSDETVITVGRVEYSERTEIESIAYETETKPTASLFEGESEVVQEGSNGIKKVVYNDKYVDGEFVSSELVSETTVSEPVNKIVNIGSKKRPALINFKDGVKPISDLNVPSYVELDENGLPKNYVDYYEGKATAYSGDPATASGRIPCQGHIAVDPKQFPYGTELYIVSLDGSYVYGYCIAADTGGFVKTTNNIADLYMDTEEMCYEWGNRAVAIYVISYAG